MAKRRRNEWDIARILRLVNKNTQFLCRFRYEECAKFEFQTDFIRFWAIAFFSPIIHFVHYFLKRLWDIWATPEKEMNTDKKKSHSWIYLHNPRSKYAFFHEKYHLSNKCSDFRCNKPSSILSREHKPSLSWGSTGQI